LETDQQLRRPLQQTSLVHSFVSLLVQQLRKGRILDAVHSVKIAGMIEGEELHGRHSAVAALRVAQLFATWRSLNTQKSAA
jgi:hypothetical protein